MNYKAVSIQTIREVIEMTTNPKIVERRSDMKKFASKKQNRTNPADFKNFLAELKMLQKLDHPNIVKLVESFSNTKKMSSS